MPRLPLAGPPYPSRSFAAAASELTNLYVEVVENPADQSKNVANLFGVPGRHALLSPAAVATIAGNGGGDMRGLWSGGGRCFTVIGSWVYEITEAGNIVVAGGSAPFNTGLNDGNPVQFAGNGNQLGMVFTYPSNNHITGAPIVFGGFMINNGAGWYQPRFQIQGTVSISGPTVTWISGDYFTADMINQVITIDGHDLVVSVVAGGGPPLTLTVAGGVGLGSGAGTCNTFLDGEVSWVSGPVFYQGMVGAPITINGLPYIVKTFVSDHFITVTDLIPGDVHGINTGVGFSTVLSGLRYNCAAGNVITGVGLAYLDGQFYVQRPAGETPDLGRQILVSDVLDGTNWSGLNFFSKEGAVDYIRSIVADGQVLYALGTENSEAFQNSPSTGLAQRVAMSKFGSISPWGAEVTAGKLYMMGGDAEGGPVAYRFDSTVPTRISTHAEESYWLKKCFGMNCVTYSYMEEGHIFWCINFSRAGDGGIGETWCWDETDKVWHRRMGWDGANFTADPTKFHTYIVEWGNGDGKHITGGVGSQMYESSSNFYDNNGADMAWRRAVPYRYNAGNFIYFGRMTLEMETGTVASGAAPVVIRDYSDDRGKTFVNPQPMSTGVHDDTSIRMYWLRNGNSRGRVWRFFGSGQSKVALIDLECDETLGTT